MTRRRSARSDDFSRPAPTERAVRTALPGHGGRRIAAGTAVVALLLASWHLVHFLALLPYFPAGGMPWLSWAILAVVAVGAFLVVRLGPGGVPTWLLVAVLLGAAAVVAADLQATAGLLAAGITPTAAAAAGLLLMPVAALRESRATVVAACAIAGVLAIAALLQLPGAGQQTIPAFAIAGSAALPVIVTAVAVRGFRRTVELELDLSLVQSTVVTDRQAVGMRASEELATLDYDAETLLDDVSSGRLPLPLDADAARRAADLAAGLRVRLIEGRTDTWLKHAVAESEFLAGSVVVDDPEGDAGRLAPPARDALLLALWLLVGDRPRGTTTPVRVSIGSEVDDAEVDDAEGAGEATAAVVRLSITVPNANRRRVDHATWDAVDSVGSHSVTVDDGGIRVDVVARADSQESTPGASPRTATRETRGT